MDFLGTETIALTFCLSHWLLKNEKKRGGGGTVCGLELKW